MTPGDGYRRIAGLAATLLLAPGLAFANPDPGDAELRPGRETRRGPVGEPAPHLLPGCWNSPGGHGVRTEGGAVIYEASARHPFAVGHGRCGGCGGWSGLWATAVIGPHGHRHRYGARGAGAVGIPGGTGPPHPASATRAPAIRGER